MGLADRARDVVLVGCGRLGSAILEGWLLTGAVAPSRLIVLSRLAMPAGEAVTHGVRVNPSMTDLSRASAVVLAVKPASWREALSPLLNYLPADAVIVSVMAGVGSAEIEVAAHRPVARVMPTTAVAEARGVAALWSADHRASEVARTLFRPLADVVTLEAEALIDPATAVAGSAPAFFYAFADALARAGEAQGLAPDNAVRLARGALRSAGAGVEGDTALDALIARIASPGGTTRAGLDAMQLSGHLDQVATAAVDAAVRRARSLSA